RPAVGARPRRGGRRGADDGRRLPRVDHDDGATVGDLPQPSPADPLERTLTSGAPGTGPSRGRRGAASTLSERPQDLPERTLDASKDRYVAQRVPAGLDFAEPHHQRLKP